MKPEELKAHAQNVLDRFPEAKYVIAFSDGNVFLDRDKNASELHAAASKRTPQRFDREEQAETPAAKEAEDDLKAGSTATDELTGKSDATTETPVEDSKVDTEEPATTPAQVDGAATETPAEDSKVDAEESATTPAQVDGAATETPAEDSKVDAVEPGTMPVQVDGAATETTNTPASKGKPKK